MLTNEELSRLVRVTDKLTTIIEDTRVAEKSLREVTESLEQGDEATSGPCAITVRTLQLFCTYTDEAFEAAKELIEMQLSVYDAARLVMPHGPAIRLTMKFAAFMALTDTCREFYKSRLHGDVMRMITGAASCMWGYGEADSDEHLRRLVAEAESHLRSAQQNRAQENET